MEKRRPLDRQAMEDLGWYPTFLERADNEGAYARQTIDGNFVVIINSRPQQQYIDTVDDNGNYIITPGVYDMTLLKVHDMTADDELDELEYAQLLIEEMEHDEAQRTEDR